LARSTVQNAACDMAGSLARVTAARPAAPALRS
jgi:hypothetical protein